MDCTRRGSVLCGSVLCGSVLCGVLLRGFLRRAACDFRVTVPWLRLLTILLASRSRKPLVHARPSRRSACRSRWGLRVRIQQRLCCRAHSSRSQSASSVDFLWVSCVIGSSCKRSRALMEPFKMQQPTTTRLARTTRLVWEASVGLMCSMTRQIRWPRNPFNRKIASVDRRLREKLSREANGPCVNRILVILTSCSPTWMSTEHNAGEPKAR